MEIAYVDESGDAGYGGSRTYTLGCVLIEDARWPAAFDAFLGFRRFIRARFGIRVRDEIKANYLLRGGGPLKRLQMGERQRRVIYRQHMRLAAKLPVKVFAVVVRKDLILKRSMNPRDVAWEFLLQRIERHSTTNDLPMMVVHDEGDSLNIRGVARKARRANTAGSAFGTGRFRLPARLLIDDPVPRQSDQSYFVQLADLAAFAAYRRLYPPPRHRFAVCHEGMWDELGGARHAPANQLARSMGTGEHNGIVSWPN
ncbi:DUF3800 domain-containing protein [Amycolatopsis jiangsuensis]|uniref:DUF3800 domain-containing protein n=1 Tax=Amycolatopsis jiangsuensis TaxID=1181879 RepID=A0A840J1N5_9PSEU|nr:DUF3800 domain-containing protein [Amycolatopsis jiangsuensis]MBB4687397.1 hypothetical protein [Amycolatopsis jiangsuensis]